MATRMRMLVLVAALLLVAVEVQGDEVVASTATIVAPADVAVAAEDDKSSTVKSVPAAAPAAAEEPSDTAVLADDSVTASNETATAEPATEEPASEEPATEETTTEEPAVEEPTVGEPAAEEPATELEVATDETIASEDVPTDGTYGDSFAEEGTLMSDDGEGGFGFEGEPSEDESYLEEASLADLPDGDDADVQDNAEPLDFGDEAAQLYGDDGVEESAAAPGVPPGFDVDESGEQSSNATDADVSDLSLAAWGGGGCQTGNMIDDCWRCDPTWASRRQSLANCAQGFGKCAVGGRNGPLYWVTSARDDNPANPAKGTLRYAVTRPGPLWIVFKTSMTIKLKGELLVTSYKTIDGRGVTVRIAGGAGITLQRVSNVIIHGLYIHDVVPTGPGRIMTSTSHVGNRGRADGDAISVFSSKCVWIDHCYFARGKDGLVDVIRGSSMVTISNSFFTQHDKVILLGASKNDYMDRDMKVTIMLNRFGPGLVQRMPRVRFGSCHIVNNDYTSGWGIYAIGGSERPVLNCEGNLFQPGSGPKGVAKKVWDGGGMYGGPKTWPWRATGNDFRNGAFFQTSGPEQGQVYAKATSCSVRPVYLVERMTRDAGPLNCKPGSRC